MTGELTSLENAEISTPKATSDSDRRVNSMANTANHTTLYRLVALSALGIVVAACGGSGGSDTDTGLQDPPGGGGSDNGGETSTGGTGSSDAMGGANNAASGGSGVVITDGTLDDLLASGCASESQTAQLSPANLLFVFDRSGSMNCNPPEGDAALNAQCAVTPQKADPDLPSKWEVTREALSSTLADLASRPQLKAGITVFPADEPEDCSSPDNVSAAPDLPLQDLDTDHLAAINDFMAGVTPAGRTPLAGATILSYQYLQQEISEGNLDGNTFVVLLTDGEETCSEDALGELIDTHVGNATLPGLNIRTFVIGAPGSEGARASLSEMAYNGNTATSEDCVRDPASPDEGDCHFDTTTSTDFAGDLTAALETITSDRQLACIFDTPSGGGQAVDLGAVNVTFSSSEGVNEAVLQDNTDCASANGWQYIRNFTQIQLCGDVCQRVQDDPEGQVSIVLGCPTTIR